MDIFVWFLLSIDFFSLPLDFCFLLCMDKRLRMTWEKLIVWFVLCWWSCFRWSYWENDDFIFFPTWCGDIDLSRICLFPNLPSPRERRYCNSYIILFNAYADECAELACLVVTASLLSCQVSPLIHYWTIRDLVLALGRKSGIISRVRDGN